MDFFILTKYICKKYETTLRKTIRGQIKMGIEPTENETTTAPRCQIKI